MLAENIPTKKISGVIVASDVRMLLAYNNKVTRHSVPIKMHEYMAIRRPVIATRRPDIVKEFGFESGIHCLESLGDSHNWTNLFRPKNRN